ncbi:MAG: VWA domain-containing protein [Gammaproteobacteria bacterium]|nr:VWA domain-containing protein [Gammaproteobacteria bacterium]
MRYTNQMAALLAVFLTAGITEGRAGTDSADINCPGGEKVCRQTATGLPLRGLPRALSTIYSGADANSEKLASNIKAFWPVYVFERKDVDYSDPANPAGWYRVGTMVNDPFGWMQAKDVMEWKQALVVSYTHPGTGDERRNSVLMFKTRDALNGIVEAEDRETRAKTAYTGLSAKPPKVPENVISREPSRFVSIEEKFYMLPVIAFEEVDLFEDETRYLQLAAAVPVRKGDTQSVRSDENNRDTLENQEFLENAGLSETIEGTGAKDLGFDIKFVMDMTGSMGPYIDRTKEAIQKAATMVKSNNVDARINYGLIGYRDDLNKAPGLEFVTKNFTPKLVNADEFVKIIATAAPARVGSADYQEETFAGVKDGITSNWEENSIKIMIVIGDASSHQVGHPRSTTGMNAEQVRDLANSNKINIISVHLKDAQAAQDHPLAETQFKTLAANPGSKMPSYIAIDAHNHDEFEKAVKTLAAELSSIVGQVRQGNIQVVKNTPKADPVQPAKGAEEQAQSIAQSIAANALIDYLGSAANPPRDITAWVMDRDLADPEVRALQVRVLLKKSELNDLIQALESVLKAVKRSQLTSMQFFDALQGVVAQGTKGGGKITVKDAKRLASSGLMPDWINSLPYRSAILEMNNDLFESLSSEERSNLEYEIEAKLQLYQEINENTDLWVALDERDARIDHVHPLPLTTLP